MDEEHKHVEVEKLDWDWKGVPPTSDVLGKTYHPIQRYKEPLDFKKLVKMTSGGQVGSGQRRE